jgi:hypothetical protein
MFSIGAGIAPVPVLALIDHSPASRFVMASKGLDG